METREAFLESLPEFDPGYFRELLGNFVAQANVSFSVVEHQTFRDITEYVYSVVPSLHQPVLRTVSRRTLIRDMEKRVDERLFPRLHEELRRYTEAGGKVNLTIDKWKSSNKLSFLGVVGHWMAEDWTRREALLGFEELDSTNAKSMCNVLLKVLKKIGIENYVGCITADNEKVNDAMFGLLEVCTWVHRDYLLTTCSAKDRKLVCRPLPSQVYRPRDAFGGAEIIICCGGGGKG